MLICLCFNVYIYVYAVLLVLFYNCPQLTLFFIWEFCFAPLRSSMLSWRSVVGYNFDSGLHTLIMLIFFYIHTHICMCIYIYAYIYIYECYIDVSIFIADDNMA